MSKPRPIEPYHFQANLIWRDGPFKGTIVRDFQPAVFFHQKFLSIFRIWFQIIGVIRIEV
jgi:hypothetical protein